jgi:glycogen operon protein
MTTIEKHLIEREVPIASTGVKVTNQSHPLGATVYPSGVNFSIFSRSASGMELLLFDREDDERPSRVIQIDPWTNRTYHYWHVFVPGIRAGQIYGFRAHGPFDPTNGLRFDSSKLLLDPYGRSVVVPNGYDRFRAAG